MTINRFCSSGLQAVALAAGALAVGSNDLVIAGGVESMSMVPMTGNKLSASPEAMEKYPSVYTPMGITAENVANKFEISRRSRTSSPTRASRRRRPRRRREVRRRRSSRERLKLRRATSASTASSRSTSCRAPRRPSRASRR
jgi:hypothetical protein